ncbi:MAG: hypothetical protein KIS87_02400 [Phycisphaeraceae bacterium]|nr:hypothetical protein [Phycisphaeraceae bacterium]
MKTDLTDRTARTRGGRRGGAGLLARAARVLLNRRASRRGSFLIMVVGVLSLLAVVAVLYAAIGRSDRQVSAAVVRSDERHGVPEQVRDYLASVIGQDVFSTYFAGERAANGLGALQRREAWDYPSSPFFVRNPAGSGFVPVTVQNFTPTGMVRLANGVYVGSGTDPWLAASEPTFLNFSGTSITADEAYKYRVDWAHISNFAPDGAFVNLYNLRRGTGNFAATPWEMRVDLRLWDDTTNANPTPARDFGGNTQPSDTIAHRPAEWTARQRAAFRPMLHPTPAHQQFGSAWHPMYQWADADGDGIPDARWFELVEARDRNTPEQWRSLLNDRRYRYFIAARAVDLSGRINVNTATDLLDAPTRDAASPGAPVSSGPLGLTPSDVDLRAALTIENLILDNASSINYSSLEQPLQGTVGDYSELDDSASGVQLTYDVGLRGYVALRESLFSGLVPPALWNDDHGWFKNDVPRSWYYREFAGSGLDAAAYATGGFTLGAPFGLADLQELLVYNGVNDPSTRSRLEAAVGGRFLGAGKPFSTLRDNRPLTLERGGVDNNVLAGGVYKGDGYLDDDALAQAWLDPRRRLTTISAARPIISRLGVTPSTPITDVDLRTYVGDVLSDTPSIQTLFRRYADALLPYSYVTSSWTGNPFYATLFYGHRGPELALHIAGHFAVNMVDAFDDDDTPTSVTLLVDPAVRDAVNADPNFPSPLLDLGDSRLGVGPSLLSSQAIVIYGIEAQPFITEAASFVMYTDTPQARGGDDDTGERQLGGGPNDPGQTVYIYDPSINGAVDASNPDFLFEVLAFQIHNPFDVPVALSGGGTGSYYIQYGDDYYKLVDGAFDSGETSVTLAPRETRVFYTLSQDEQSATDRINNALGLGQGNQDLKAWISTQLGGNAVRVPPADISAGTIDTSGSFRNLQSGTDASRRVVRLWRTQGVGSSPILVDRLRDPAAAGATLDRQLTNHGANQAGSVSGAQRGPEPPNANFSPDNRGLSITRHASLRRRDDPRAGASSDSFRSFIPAYCIESKWQNALQNVTSTDGTSARLSIGDFVNTKGDKTLNGLLNKQAGPAAQKLIPTLTGEPSGRTGNTIGNNLAGRSLHGGMPGETPLYAVPSLDNNKFESASGLSRFRVADLLLPLGLGPTQDPLAADEDERWTTLSEALAIALYFENPPSGLYQNAFTMDVGAPRGSALEAGQLVLDDFVPFTNADNSGIFNPQTDVRWGLGVPLALTVLDAFTTMPREFGSTNVGTFGVINVNTAPLEVLRAVPGFSPMAPPPSGTSWWSGTGHDETSDIASTVYAYRDRLAVFPRDFYGVPTNLLNFRDGSGGPPPGSPPGYDPADDGRTFATGIPAIREMPGLLTPGELLAVRDTEYPDTAFPHDIDRLGFNGQSVSHPGLESVRYGTGGTETDDFADDWAERLVIANAAMSSVSVRSDVFAVWFVLHGYQESDVKGLANDQPMTPSIARRFLMVVDRSNVVRPGDKPRILLFKEVPL